MPCISYAQKFENFLLIRALVSMEQGFYFGLGAYHPLVDSVSRAFFQKDGWRGVHVHIQPVPRSTQRLREDRHDEPVLQSIRPGATQFYEIHDTDLSTCIQAIAEEQQNRGFQIRKALVNQTTLAATFALARGRESTDLRLMWRELRYWCGAAGCATRHGPGALPQKTPDSRKTTLLPISRALSVTARLCLPVPRRAQLLVSPLCPRALAPACSTTLP